MTSADSAFPNLPYFLGRTVRWRRGALLAAVLVAAVRPAFSAPVAANYDESKVGTYTLPDPLVLQNGKPVRDAKTWVKKRRPEILKAYEEEIYGRSPGRPGNMKFDVWDTDRKALDGKAVRKQIDIKFSGRTNNPVIHVVLYTPAGATGPVPTFVCLSFSGNYKISTDPGIKITETWDRKRDTSEMPADTARGTSHSWRIADTLARGYGVAAVYYCDIEPDLDDGTGARYGVRSMYMKPGRPEPGDNWGSISAWAWGASRVADYLETDKDVDRKQLIMLGQSRLGKTALWAGAQDERFAMVIASCSGEMGASLGRRNYGETIDHMIDVYSYQFCPNFKKYKGRWNEMPVDTHMLISLIAPRPLYLSTGSLDQWSDPKGEFLAARAAEPVYKLLGKEGLDTDAFPPLDHAIMHDIGFSCHTGKHDILPEDWDRFLDFADMHLKHPEVR